MFRLPTHLESLVPPPRDQVPQTQPWRGAIFLPASSPHSAAQPREIRVTAAETENDNQQQLWPKHLQLQIVKRRGVLREVHSWLAQSQLEQYPRCMLMPDRLPDQAASRENQVLFETLARQLLEEEIVAIAPWSYSEAFQHGGILLYPTTTSRALLVGIVFLNAGFPEFIQGSAGSHTVASLSSRVQHLNLLPRLQPFQPVTHHTPFDPAPPSIASSSRHSASGYDTSRGRTGRNSG